MASSILLRGGIALIHDGKDHVKPTKTDILISGSKISKISPHISTPSSCQTIDCTDKIISPGFIDTHHHVWQTQLKGRHADETLVEYMYSGNMQSSNYTTKDIYWGQLGGCLEAIDCGTTMVVDHAHLNYTPESSPVAISATVDSGIRSIFGYCPTPRVSSWSPFQMAQDMLADWVVDTLETVCKNGPYGNGRVTMGLSYDGWLIPKEIVVPFIEKAKALGVKLITSHYVRCAQTTKMSLVDLINSYGLLDEKILLSHATGSTKQDAKLIHEKGVGVSSTPSTELQMGHGSPVCFDDNLRDLSTHCGLGIDCHSNNAASIPQEMRLALQNARAARAERMIEQGKAPLHLNKFVQDAFNLGTIQGARVIGMEKDIGSIAVGKNADLTIFDALTPGMICAATHEPVAAIVLHSSPKDIDTVIVDGQIRKFEGKLTAVTITDQAKLVGRDTVEWNDVARELLESRKSIQEKIEKLDFKMARDGMIKLFRINEGDLVDEI